MKCQNCEKDFTLSLLEIKFREKINITEPTFCPECRQQRRFSFRNERKLYHRKCDLTGKQIISIYPQDSNYKVYDQHEWHSDRWNALSFGRDYDFSRSFFEQMNELMLSVPKISVFTSRNENSDFTNGTQQDKNCYMIFVSDHNEDCYFSYGIDSSKDCTDCLNCFNCELCLECIDCSESYNLVYSEKTHNSSDSYFLFDCKNCKNCFGCFGLRGKEYYIYNQPFTKEEYDSRIKEFNLGSYTAILNIKNYFKQLVESKQIHQYYDGNKNEDVTGDHIVGCKNCENIFDSGNVEDSGNLIFSFNSKDCFDGHVLVDQCELCYETVSSINQYNTQFTYCSWYSKDSMYLDHCISCRNCFACSGLKKEEYCIFNKKYTKEEYEKLKNKIIEQMKQVGDFGNFFPISLSPFGYNETVAYEYFPLTKETALKKGYKWRDEDNKNYAYAGPECVISDHIKDIDSSVLEKILLCQKSKKPYKIIKQEFELFKAHNLPLPRLCFEERHLERVHKRNPRKLFLRSCMSCEKSLKTTYSPERSDIIYCEECYLKTIN